MIADLIRKGSQHPFWRNVGILAGGTVIAQGVMVLALPALTRLYSPDDFNLLAVYASTLGLLTVASCLRFNIAIPLPPDDRTAMDLLALALLSGTVVALAVGVPALLAPIWSANLLRQPELAPYMWLLPLGVLFAATYDALQYWASRKRRYGTISQTRMTRAIGGVGTQLGMGAAVAGPSGLLFGHMLLNGFGFFGLARSIFAHDRALARGTRWTEMRNAALKYRQFPCYSVPEALFNTAALEISILIIAAMAIGPEAGYLMLAMRVIGIPMSFIGTSVAQVWLTDAPEKLRAGGLAAFTRQTMMTLAKVGALPIIVAGALAPFLFPVIFGPQWARAGVILAWLTPMFMLQFIISPTSSVPHVLGRVRWAMGLQGAMCAVRLGAVATAAKVAPDFLVETFAIAGATCYALSIIWIYRMALTAERR
ncbi:MAG: oligosaccharide flippase family protein [Sphingopyxis sp.]